MRNKGEGKMSTMLHFLHCKKCNIWVWGVVVYLVLCLPALSIASPDTVSFESAVVWRADDKGDYKFDQESFSSPGTHEIYTMHTTDGNINNITAAWKFTGEVTLEVSADNGFHYTPVVNAVPLTSGFIKGNQIRWKATIASESELTEVRIVYTDGSRVQGGFGEPQLSGFRFRKPIYIDNPSGEGLFNYQLNLKVASSEGAEEFDVHCEGRIWTGFTGIRFTAADGETLLPYWRESIIDSGSAKLASFWVRIPQLPMDGGKIYVYYGNNGASDLSNAEEVFDFFDDFKGEGLDIEKWDTHIKLEGNFDIVGSQLKLNSAKVVSKDYQIKDGIIEYQARAISGYETRMIIKTEKEPSGAEDFTQIAYSSAYEGAEHCIAIGDIVKANDNQPILADTAYCYRVITKEGDISFERYDTEFKEKQASISFRDSAGLTTGAIGLETGEGNVSYYDWIRVRRYADPEPGINTLQSGLEQKVTLPVFTNLTIAENGNLILKDPYTEGTYISKKIISSFLTRIMVPSWTGDMEENGEILVDVSADNGTTYKKDCEKDSFCYASLGDFTPGFNLISKVRISRDSENAECPQLEDLSVDYRPGKILVISPNGGEVWGIGTYKEIAWTALDYEAAYPMRLDYSLDGGKHYKVIIEQIENNGAYLWRVPGEKAYEVMIKVSDAHQPEIFDTSDNSFRLEKVAAISNYLGQGEGKWSDPKNWVHGKMPDLWTEVTIATDATVYAEEEISFRSLTIGDGAGKHTTTLVLRHKINPESGQIIIRKGGILIQETNEPLSITGNLTIKSGGLLTHGSGYGLDITVENIIIEPEAIVDVDTKNNLDGGLIRLNARDNFSIFGTITADGADRQGGNGGSIYLTADIFGGEGAAIHAEGGSSDTQGGTGGEIHVKGHHGAITGSINVNAGKGKSKGKTGSIVFE